MTFVSAVKSRAATAADRMSICGFVSPMSQLQWLDESVHPAFEFG
jgi:hypothetical protein